MVILRRTRKLSPHLPAAAVVPPSSDAALGDWYANRIVVDRRPLLLLVSSTSLLPMLIPARDVRRLPDRLAALVEARLKRCGIDDRIIDAEVRAMSPVVIGPTVDRSVLGIMLDFSRAIPWQLQRGKWGDDSLSLVEDRLAKTPCYASRSADQVVFPDVKAPETLRTRWTGCIVRSRASEI